MSALTRECRPKLAPKAKLKWDRHGNKHMLLYPERGLVLNETAAEILKLCDGERTIEQIASELAKTNDGPPSGVEGDVLLFLESLYTRALLTIG
jgi:pyrroloquinoline quinone biosynthesis protein D